MTKKTEATEMAEEREYTAKEICEAYVIFKGLDMTGEQFFYASPYGELYHVFLAAQEMKDAGYVW